ncbi:MAG TPA: polynucleotide adenylyltransferase PcnB [Rhodocyclaceae bacterium]|nr:polynucleotide adenylyltransferase PcnB [Rhodocyclaceae bacterium]
MIRKLLRRVFKKPVRTPHHSASKSAKVAELPVSVHGIRREQVSSAARRTCDTLQQAGFKAYVVGGAVRDLLIGVDPKDYDVATDATPDQVRNLFRRARIIGRRFQIVHVMFGQETIEVSTFRAAHDQNTITDEHGRVLHDNVWGTQAADAARRDFTANALYYDPHKEAILDYHNGVADIKKKTLRMIGEPKLRYREDPVRMLRAVRLAAKLGLKIDPATEAPIRDMADLLENVPPARLFDEMLKLLTSGHAVACIKRLRAAELHHGLLPLLDVILEQPMGEKFVMLSLANTDARVQAGKTTSPGFLFATLLWHEVLANWEIRKKRGELPLPALFEAMDEILDQQGEKLAITRRIAGDIKDIWLLQPRFEKRSGKQPMRLLEQPRFRAGYDFLLLRAQSGEVDMELADWWTAFHEADYAERETMLLPDADPKKRRRRKRSNSKKTTGPESSGEAA